MTVLTIKTDQPQAELAVYQDGQLVAEENWPAHRQLAETIHTKIKKLVAINDLQGIVCFSGPGSFTGLRIGLSVGNALAYGLGIPVVGAAGKNWQASGLKKLQAGQNDVTVMPHYGAPVHITQPRK